jgi:uncharacterized surface protein with fasciclin (FAS1) repeats
MRFVKSGTLLAAAALIFAAVNMSADARGPKGPPADAGGPKGPSVVDVAIELNSDTNSPYFGAFDILITAVVSADPAVYAYLDGNGQRTVFAPVDDAFEDLGLDEEAVAGLDPGLLTEILLYHVARGRRDADSVLGASRIRMLDGGFVMQDGGVLTDSQGLDANIIVTDVEAANGIIHAIDAVLQPFEL